MMLELLDNHNQNLNLGLNLAFDTKINSKWILDLNVKLSDADTQEVFGT